MKLIGNKIKILRQEKKWSQKEVASMLHISVPALSKIETGITNINISRLMQISALFQIPAAVILVDKLDVQPDRQNIIDQLKDKIDNCDKEISELHKKLIMLYEMVRESNTWK